MKPLKSGDKLNFAIAITVASMAVFLGSCNQSQSDSSATDEREAIESVTANSDRATNPENATPQALDPSKAEDIEANIDANIEADTEVEETAVDTPIETSISEDNSTAEAEIIELPDFVDETDPNFDLNLDPNVEESEVEETQPEAIDETTDETGELIETQSPSTPEKRAIEVEDFDFQLRRVSVENEIIDRASNKRLSADNADEPSSYLLVELDLKNNSDEVMWDSVLYTLECGDGNIIENAADVARVYRANQNIKISSEIPPGGKGLVADAFLVPEYCLKSNDLNLIVSPVGKGKATIPLNLE